MCGSKPHPSLLHMHMYKGAVLLYVNIHILIRYLTSITSIISLVSSSVDFLDLFYSDILGFVSVALFLQN